MNNDNTKQKIGFWVLIAIIINAQLGASIFLLPSKIAVFGPIGIIGWIIGGIGAISVAMVFGFLCLDTPKTGGPHVYARMMFGDKVGFLVTWLYWCGSWMCNPILISTSIDYLEQVVGNINTVLRFILEFCIVVLLTLLNIKGIKWAGILELVMIIFKLFPLILIPILVCFNTNLDSFANFTVKPTNGNVFTTIINASVVAFWGFVGLEEGGSTAGSVKNAKKTVPLAIILGTTIVAIVSLINTISVFCVIPCEQLKEINAPFSVVLARLLGGSYDKLTGILVFIMCCGSLNAWILFSGHLGQTAAEENMFPKFLGKTNKNGSPFVSLWIAAIGTIIILGILEFTRYKNVLSDFLNMSVIMYIVLYLIAVASYLTFLYMRKQKQVIKLVTTILAFLFCSTMLFCSNYMDFLAVIIVLLTSLPVYFKLKNDK